MLCGCSLLASHHPLLGKANRAARETSTELSACRLPLGLNPRRALFFHSTAPAGSFHQTKSIGRLFLFVRCCKQQPLRRPLTEPLRVAPSLAGPDTLLSPSTKYLLQSRQTAASDRQRALPKSIPTYPADSRLPLRAAPSAVPASYPSVSRTTPPPRAPRTDHTRLIGPPFDCRAARRRNRFSSLPFLDARPPN